ncbi:MAG: MBL fold metallo-hydrolase [Candidatus Paceibacterota bacterium]|jgi:hypothetical protein
MKISWCGEACFQVTTSSDDKEGVSIVIDEKEGKKSKADIVLKTHEFNSMPQKKDGQFFISSWGEYEAKGVFVQGVPSLTVNKGKNIIFLIEAEGVRVCHLGFFGEQDINEEQSEAIGRVDILLVPVDGDKTINFKEAERIIAELEPKMVIPMAYNPKKKDALNAFLKAMGEKEIASQEKLSVNKKSFSSESEKAEIIILEEK